MPSERGRNQVSETEGVKTAAEDTAGDAVEDGEVPCYLRLVDGEMG